VLTNDAIFDHGILFDIVVINPKNLTYNIIVQLNELAKTKKVKIVVLSELFTDITFYRIDKLKVDFYLQKPFSKQVIFSMIHELYGAPQNNMIKNKKSYKNLLASIENKIIVVAEDNKINRKLIKNLLKSIKSKLIFVDNGKKVIDIIDGGSNVDLILMDINMPIMNGYETTEIIRKNAKFDKITIVALSADNAFDSINKALNKGMQDYIVKPIEIESFYKKLFYLLKD